MGYFSDSLDFEKFFAKDLWSNLKKDPKRLILGVDPASTWAWNKVLGRDDDPLVDQMGGPYDGRVFSYGHGNGGVYDRAQAAGIDTTAAQGNHDAAHLIAGSFAAGGLGNAGGNVFGSGGGAQPNLWNQAFSGKTNFSTGMPSTGTSATAGIPGIAGPVGGGTGASSAAGMGPQEWAKLGMGLAQQPQQGQQQQPPPQAPVRNMAQPQPVPTMGQRISGGLGRVSAAMFPVDPNTGMTADQIRQMQTNGLMQMGLGMLGASSQGAGFGEAAARGYGLAHGNVQGAMQQAYENAMRNRAEARSERREERDDARLDSQLSHQQWLQEHTLDREQTADERYASEQDFRLKQADQAQKRWEAEQRAMADWRQAQIDGVTRNAEVRVTDRGMFEKDPKSGEWKLVPGTEPTGVAGRPIPQGMASDLKTNATVIGQIDKVLPMLDTKEGEGAVGTRNAVIGALTPDFMSDNVKNFVDPSGTDTRAIITNLNSFVVKERNGAAVTVAEFARQRGFLPTDSDEKPVIKKKLANLREAIASEQQYILDFAESQGYRAPPASVRAPGAGLGQAPAPVRKSVGGRNYVQINGQWFEDDGTSPGQ
jgi:hypothetical protein